MTRKEDEENDYKEKVRQFTEAERARNAQRRETEVVKLSRLKARMPLGCWIWVLILTALAFGFMRWILQAYPNILS